MNVQTNVSDLPNRYGSWSEFYADMKKDNGFGKIFCCYLVNQEVVAVIFDIGFLKEIALKECEEIDLQSVLS